VERAEGEKQEFGSFPPLMAFTKAVISVDLEYIGQSEYVSGQRSASERRTIDRTRRTEHVFASILEQALFYC
jgi:hypothetical protein